MRGVISSYLLIASISASTCFAEFQINTRTSSNQANSAIAMDVDGNFVIVWSSYNQDGNSNGIFGQRFDPNCDKVGVEFQINTTWPGNQKEAAVAMNAAGNFVVVWYGPGLLEEDQEDIFARRFDPNALALDDEFRVNSHTNDEQLCPSVAMNDDGTFVVVWESMNILAEGNRAICGRLYDSNGLSLEVEFVINENTSDCRYPDVAMDPNGKFAVVWMEDGSSNNLVMVRLYNADGSARTKPLDASTIKFNTITRPSIAMDANGYFVVAWDGDPNHASDDDIHACLYDPNGTPFGDQFIVNTTTTEAQQYPQVAMNKKGEFVIVWESEIESSTIERDIFGQRFDSLGQPIGGEFQLNTFVESDQRYPDVVLSENGVFVTVWQSKGQDGAGWGVFGEINSMADFTEVTSDDVVETQEHSQ